VFAPFDLYAEMGFCAGCICDKVRAYSQNIYVHKVICAHLYQKRFRCSPIGELQENPGPGHLRYFRRKPGSLCTHLHICVHVCIHKPEKTGGAVRSSKSGPGRPRDLPAAGQGGLQLPRHGRQLAHLLRRHQDRCCLGPQLLFMKYDVTFFTVDAFFCQLLV